MAARPTAWRGVLLTLAVLALYSTYTILSLGYHQWIFQKYLAASYITWDDFPPSYSDVLRAKDWKGLEEFDHSPVFPLPDVNGSTEIPPLIHFIWFNDLYKPREGLDKIFAHGAPLICTERNLRLIVKVWSAEEAQELLREHYAWFLPTYDAYRFPIQRVDAFKYFLLYHHGGIYMDMDMECRRSLEPLLPFPAWFPEASPFGVNNDLMATRAGHPVIRFMIDNLKARNKDWVFPYLTIFWSTGPQFTSDLLKRWFLTHGPTYEKGENKIGTGVDNWFVLPRDFYSEEFTFFGHTPGGTWHEEDVAVILWFVAHPVTFWCLCAVLLVLMIVFTRSFRRRRRKHVDVDDHEA